jgi:hypothetical protein
MKDSQREAYCERLDTLPWSRDDEDDDVLHDESLNIDTVESLSVNKGPLVECLKLQQICSHPHLLQSQEEYTLESSSKLIFLRHLLRRLYDSPEQRSKNHRVVVLSRSRKLLDLISLYVCVLYHPILQNSLTQSPQQTRPRTQLSQIKIRTCRRIDVQRSGRTSTCIQEIQSYGL